MPSASMNVPSLRFDRFELQPGERRLLDEGQPVPVGARAFDVLMALAGRAGHLVTKAELMDQVWPGLVVEENNLAAQVSALRKVLGGEIIATIPGRGYRFTAVPQIIVEAESAPAGVVAAPAAAAGPRLFGRDADLARISADLATPGCITLVGAAGIGKTRLAQAIAARWPGRFVWVDLAALANQSQILAALGRSLETTLPEHDPAPALARALRGDQVLVVLDNAEHVVDAVAALVATLRQAAGHARMLVTSQLPLAVPAERVERLEPLTLPAPNLSDADALQDGAVALLVDRITAADHRFRATPETVPVLREICTRLDGLPLALEMAAARVPLLGLHGVRDALTQRFALLTTGHRVAPARHKTLHAALDWSHGLLSAAEQRLFRALGVFVGGFTLDLVAAVAADAQTDRWSIIDRLAVLVDRSLVAASHDDPPRYSLLETMRAYALEQLATAGDEQSVRRRHAQVMADVFKEADSTPYDRGGARLRAEARAEFDNAREAMSWALRDEIATAITLATHAASVVTFTVWRGESIEWLAACEPQVDDRVELRTRALWTFEYARQLLMSEHERALPLARHARDLMRQLDDPVQLFRGCATLIRALREPGPELDQACAEFQDLLDGHPEWNIAMRMLAAGALAVASEARGDMQKRLAYRENELAYARELGNSDQADAAESNVILALSHLGRLDEAVTRSTVLMERIGGVDTGNAAYGWLNHVDMLVTANRLDDALRAAPRALALARRFNLPTLSDALALLVAKQGRARAAARLVGYGMQAYASHSMNISANVRQRFNTALDVARQQLDESTLQRLLDEGRRLDDAGVDRLLFRASDDA